jgi:hypothetical protein
VPLTSNEIEAANRAEATVLLIRGGYRVYRPEADVHGEDLILRSPAGELLGVQLKARPTVELAKYGGKNIWLLFPDPSGMIPGRDWFLVLHDVLFEYEKGEHGTAPMWNETWSNPRISKKLRAFLKPFELRHFVAAANETT